MAKNQQTVFSLRQVSQHKSRKDTWFVIDGKVYDVSKFLEEHPGGDDVLVEVAGRDATADFDAIGHSKAAKTSMAKYQVGVLGGFVSKVDAAGLGTKGEEAEGGGAKRSRWEEMSARVVKEDAVTKWAGVIQFVVPLFVALFFWGYRVATRDAHTVPS